MDVYFYTITDDPKKVSKTLGSAVVTKTGIKPFDPVSEQEPVLLLEHSSQYDSVNYAKITKDGKTWYYFVDQPVLAPGNRVSLQLRLDVLMTNKSEILNLDVIVGRSSSDFNSYMYDPKQQGQVNKLIESLFFNDYDRITNSPYRTFRYDDDNIVVAAIGGE